MKKIVYILMIFTVVLFSTKKFEYAQVEVNSIEDIKFLQDNKIDIDRTSFGMHGKPINGKITVYVSDDQYSIIKKNGYEVQMTSELKPKYDSDYRFNEDIEDSMDVWVARYPNICKKEIIGYSVENRPLLALKISDNVNIEEAEPEVKFIATMHGDEPVGTEMEMEMIEDILYGYTANNDTMQFLVNNTELYVMPLMNPDGMANNTRYNSNSIDLNRNFPEWTNSDPDSIDGYNPYSGSETAIENEAIMTWTQNHNFILSTNYHTGAEVVNYLYDKDFGISSGSEAQSPEDDHISWLAYGYGSRNSRLFSSTEFTNGITNGSAWYSIDNGMQDWNYKYHNDIDMTLELSGTKWPSFSEIPDFWEENRDAMFWYLSAAHKGIYGIVTNSVTGLPVDATIEITGIDKDYYTDPDCGDYYRILQTGTYELTVSANGYYSQTISNIIVTDDTGVFKEATEVNVQLVPEGDVGGTFSYTPSSLIYGNISVGNSSTLTFQISNGHSTEVLTGTITTPEGYSVSESSKEILKSSKNSLGYTIDAGSSDTFNIVFEPTVAGSFNGNVSITSSDTNHSTEYIAVTGSCIAPEIDVPSNLAASAVPGNSVIKNFDIDNTGSGSLDYSIAINYTSGKSIKASGGPDTYGYKWSDSDELDGPVYSWEEINSTGTALGLGDDGESSALTLGFTFNFYGVDYTELVVGANGATTFTGTAIAYLNPTIPTSATANAVLAPFWDDLNPSSIGEIYYYSDTANNRFIIEWDGVVKYGDSTTNTFQIILYESGKIVYQYADMQGDLDECTVGIEDHDGTDGSLVTYNTAYLKDDLAIQFQATAEWLTLDTTSGTVAGSGSDVIAATCDATDLELGVYTADLIVTSNDPDEPTMTISVTFTVSDVVVLGAPENLVTATVIATEANLVWDAVTGATIYHIYRSTDPYGTFAEIGTSTTNAYTDTDVLSGNKYFYYVTSDNAK